MRGIEAVLANKKKSPITHVDPSTLTVADFTACLAFYRRALGLMLRRQVGREAEFDVAGSAFTLRGDASRASEGPRDVRVVTRDLRRVQASIEASGGALVEAPTLRTEGAEEVLQAVAEDPDGNRLTLLQPA